MKTKYLITEVDGWKMHPPFTATMSERGKYHPDRVGKPTSTNCEGCGGEILIGEHYFYFEELQGRSFCLACVEYEME